MKRLSFLLAAEMVSALGICGNTFVGAGDIPFVDALDSAVIVQTKLDDPVRDSMLVGNGDVTGLLFTRNGTLGLNISKNDVWDARIDTSEDPELLTIDVKSGTFGGSHAAPGSWSKPYPSPWICGKLVFGEGGEGQEAVWQEIRAQGKKNSWEKRGDASVMTIEGAAGASNGYAYKPLAVSTDEYTKFCFKISGTSNAKYYVDMIDRQGGAFLSSGWKKTPLSVETVSVDLPKGKDVHQLVLYTWTIDGKKAENRFEDIALAGSGSVYEIGSAPESTGSSPVQSRLDIRRAVASVNQVGEDGSEIKTTVRAIVQDNAFLIESDVAVHLLANTAPHIPGARKGMDDDREWLVQELPADEDWQGMSYAIALVRDGKRHAVSIVTSFESKTPKESAMDLADRIIKSSDTKTIKEHEHQWEKFWSASGVDLDDAELRDMWYQNLYFLRCVSNKGVKAVGLFAGSGKNSYMWHGSHTLNYNCEQTFWGGFNTNHAELADPYIRMIHRYLPRAKWFANKVYSFEGAHFPHNVFTHEPPDPEKCVSRNNHMHAFAPYAHTIGVSGHIVHNLWMQYLYSPDREYLEGTAYPVIRAVALFYVNYVENCKEAGGGKIVLGPSYSPEHWSLTDPKRNHDCTYDIAFIQLTLRAAIEGGTVLGRDEALIKRCRGALAKLPEYPTTKGADPVVVDVEGAPPINYNITVPTIPVFPGDQVTWFSDEAQKELFARTIDRIQWNGNNAMIMLAVARGRLSMPGTWKWLKDELTARRFGNGTIALNRKGVSVAFNSAGIYTEQFAASGAIGELLIQSVDDIIRIFPAWPKEKDARFVNLRAQGGFLVSAEQKWGRVISLVIESTVGGKLRLLNPWENGVKANGKTLTADSGGIVEVQTRQGQRLVFSCEK